MKDLCELCEFNEAEDGDFLCTDCIRKMYDDAMIEVENARENFDVD
jgi:hypothetical protein